MGLVADDDEVQSHSEHLYTLHFRLNFQLVGEHAHCNASEVGPLQRAKTKRKLGNCQKPISNSSNFSSGPRREKTKQDE